MQSKSANKNTEILYVIGSLDLGGAERHLAQIAPALKTIGWAPTIYCLTHHGVQSSELESHGVTVIGPPVNTNTIAFLRPFALMASCARLLAILIWRRPRIVHFFLPLAYVMGAPLSLLAATPIRVMSRRSLNLYQRRYPLISWLERKLHRHMSCVLGNSRAVINDLLAEGVSLERTKLIYNGIDLTPFSQRSSAEKDASAPLVFIIVANLIPYKGHADLIEALASITDALPKGWELWCIGRDDGLKESLEQLAKKKNVGANIKFLGSRADVHAFLKAADISVLCSHEEGFSNAILEAMAAGVPVVATNVGGNAEAIVHDETGLIVPPRDSVALGQALLKLALAADLRKEMGRRGRERVQQRFSLYECAQAYSSLYSDLLNPRTVSRGPAA